MRVKIIVLGLLVLIIDFFVSPLLAHLQSVVKYHKTSFLAWYAEHLDWLWLWGNAWTNHRSGLLVLQGMFVLLYLLGMGWMYFAGKKYAGLRKSDSIEHGSSKLYTEHDMPKHYLPEWKFNDELPKGKNGQSLAGIVLGTDLKKKKMWMATDDMHTLILGGTRAGKNFRVIFPTLFAMAKSGQSVVVLDPKGESREKTKTHFEKHGYNIITFDCREFGRRSDGSGNQYNPLTPIIELVNEGKVIQAAKESRVVAQMLYNAANKQSGSSGGDKIWENGAVSVLIAVILYVVIELPDDEMKHLGSVQRLISELGRNVQEYDPQTRQNVDILPLDVLMNTLPTDHPSRTAWNQLSIAGNQKTIGGFLVTASTSLTLWADPSTCWFTELTDFDMKEVGQKPTIIYLVFPDEDNSFHSIASIFLHQLYTALVDVANEAGGRLPVQTNFLLDEFGSIPSIHMFSQKITVSAGRGIRWCLIVQDLEQIESAYKTDYNTIVGNCSCMIYLATNSNKTAKYVSERVGKMTIATKSYSTSTGKNDNMSVSDGKSGREIMMPDEVQHFDPDTKRSLILMSRKHAIELPCLGWIYVDVIQDAFVSSSDDGEREISSVLYPPTDIHKLLALKHEPLQKERIDPRTELPYPSTPQPKPEFKPQTNWADLLEEDDELESGAGKV